MKSDFATIADQPTVWGLLLSISPYLRMTASRLPGAMLIRAASRPTTTCRRSSMTWRHKDGIGQRKHAQVACWAGTANFQSGAAKGSRHSVCDQCTQGPPQQTMRLLSRCTDQDNLFNHLPGRVIGCTPFIGTINHVVCDGAIAPAAQKVCHESIYIGRHISVVL